jgi:hypothetical protein
MNFGFVIPENANNAIILENPLTTEDPQFELKREILKKYNAWRFVDKNLS